MDKKTPGKEGTTEEVTRESLIAISYSLQDKATVASKLSSDNLNGEKQEVVEERIDSADPDEKYRSALISISYSHSPDQD
ncbi:hypothetical protein PTKIN_Ptkin01aG0274100 [Pterospermum kingtungense]